MDQSTPGHLIYGYEQVTVPTLQEFKEAQQPSFGFAFDQSKVANRKKLTAVREVIGSLVNQAFLRDPFSVVEQTIRGNNTVDTPGLPTAIRRLSLGQSEHLLAQAVSNADQAIRKSRNLTSREIVVPHGVNEQTVRAWRNGNIRFETSAADQRHHNVVSVNPLMSQDGIKIMIEGPKATNTVIDLLQRQIKTLTARTPQPAAEQLTMQLPLPRAKEPETRHRAIIYGLLSNGGWLQASGTTDVPVGVFGKRRQPGARTSAPA